MRSISLLPILTIILIVLQLTGIISWAWFWVLLPLGVHGVIVLYIIFRHVVLKEYGPRF